MLTLPQWLAISAIVLGAAILRGVVGFGFAVATVSLFSVALVPADAVLLSVLLQVGIGAWESPAAARVCDWRVLQSLLLGTAVTTPLGLFILRHLAAPAARLVLAAASLIALAGIVGPHVMRRMAAATPPVVVGGIAGILNGLSAMPGPPVVAYFMSRATVPVVARASLVVFFAAAAIVSALNAWMANLIGMRLILMAASMLPALLLGSALGAWLFTLASARLYRPLAIWTLAVSVAVAVWKSLADFCCP